jgi:tetratricopeptide (TPR) repeat protein
VYERYLRGRYALNKRTEADLHAAVSSFTETTSEAPEFALAWSGLADALLLLGVYGALQPTDVMPRARDAAEQALRLNPALGEAYATLGAVRALFEWDWARSEDSFRRAMALSPRYPTAWQWCALNLLVPCGRYGEARDAIERARALDPLSMVITTSVGVVQHLAADTRALHTLRHAESLDPGFLMTHYFLGNVLRDAGDLAGSVSALQKAIDHSGGTPEIKASLAQTLARQGNADGARRLLAELSADGATRHVSPCLLAQVRVALDERDAALDDLERAVATRDPELVFIGARPAYAPLRGQPRFDAIRARLAV